MAQKAEYRVIAESSPAKLMAELNQLASQGWKPILMASAGGAGPVVTTVILEHVLGS